MAIKLLPPEVASQIAAGEVVERPASVVKELLENALDSGATQITLRIEGAGKRRVEAADNGCGIPASELPLAVSRHATSKLSTAEDLFHIKTLGFRGEALASIGSVSRLTITTRPREAEVGVQLRVDGGHEETLQPVGAPVGTVVRVEDLFFNVPARLKFLKQDATEKRLIDQLVTRYALAYPQVRFQLMQDGSPVLQTSGNGDQREILASLYGVDTARQMIAVLAQDENLSVTGFISPTSLTRSNRREMVFFVNGRPVQDAALSSAVLQAYHTLLMVGRFPIGILFLKLSPEQVDVNVHPTKAEVRFRDASSIFSGLQRAVRRALLAHTPVPDLNAQLRWEPGATRPFPGRDIGSAWGMSGPLPDAAAAASLNALPGRDQDDTERETSLSPQLAAPILRLVGQIASSFLAAEGPDGLYLIDQHAAHERILFEKMMAQHNSLHEKQGIPSQSLLQPATVELSPAEARLLNEQLPVLLHLGFQVESFGPRSFIVRSIPALLTGVDPAAALRVVVEDFEEDETPLQSEIEARIAARVCKRAAIKAGKILSPEEQRALLSDLEACSSPRTCPHGRPTMIHLSLDLLERQFGRRGAR